MFARSYRAEPTSKEERGKGRDGGAWRLKADAILRRKLQTVDCDTRYIVRSPTMLLACKIAQLLPDKDSLCDYVCSMYVSPNSNCKKTLARDHCSRYRYLSSRSLSTTYSEMLIDSLSRWSAIFRTSASSFETQGPMQNQW